MCLSKAYSFIHGESMINSCRQCDHVSLRQSDSYPAVIFVPNIKVRSSIQDVSNLIIEVQVFLIERF